MTKYLTIKEAMKLALDILEKAELERLQYADEEAKRTPDMDDEPCCSKKPVSNADETQTKGSA